VTLEGNSGWRSGVSTQPNSLPDPIGVLIIDDHQMFAESLARLLADEPDISVLGVVSEAAEALPSAVRLRPHVVLVDYKMPGQDGVDIARAIKSADPNVTIVMLTGWADDRVLLSAIEAGCSGFLTKDRAATEVAGAVRAAANGEALITGDLLARLLPRLGRNHHELGSDLTEREIEVFELMARGWPNAAIASHLFLSVNTIRNYVQSILTKLGAHSKLEAVSTGVRERIIRYPVGT
jgi:DNA-binding NarL/FixJ family response regulator